ncbi:MAG: ABC transporter substrate-binding protein [Candidatus Eremiobacteraeota bacterium]|nr:ABC transporter substrate-binding protein [Candidatus Eremiobacteraeota bacterium]
MIRSRLASILRIVVRWSIVALALVVPALLFNGDSPAVAQPQHKFKIFISLSFSGDAWLNEAANAIKALAATPPYDKMVDIKEVISGMDPQKQISDYESMIASGADAIISMPVSTTALNRTIKRGCDKGVVFFMFELTSLEPCTYNVSTLTSGFGENSAQALVNMIHGRGTVFMVRLIPGFIADVRHYNGAMSVFKKYPKIKTIEFYGNATDETVQVETSKMLATHPNVDAIWSTAGESGVIKALLATGRSKLVPVTGESSNGFRLALANPDYQKRGLQGVSSGGTPATAGYAFKLMMELLTKQRTNIPHYVEYPLPWVPADKVKVCSGDHFANGCNAFPKSRVADSFFDEIFSPQILPELSIHAVLTGQPTPGARIRKLTNPIVAAPPEPGITCDRCTPPPYLYHLTKVRPTASP